MAVSVNIEKNFRDFSLKVDFEGSSAAIGLLGASGSGKSDRDFAHSEVFQRFRTEYVCRIYNGIGRTFL